MSRYTRWTAAEGVTRPVGDAATLQPAAPQHRVCRHAPRPAVRVGVARRRLAAAIAAVSCPLGVAKRRVLGTRRRGSWKPGFDGGHAALEFTIDDRVHARWSQQ